MGTVDSRHNLRGPRGALLGQLDTRLLAGQARVAILQAIFDGRFTEKLPNEERLAEMLNVSRTTVRAALLGLERDGVVTRHRAIGTLINPHVRPSSLALQRLIGFDGLLTERGYEVRVELASEWVLAGEEIARAFDLEPTRECLRLEKEYWADEALALVIIDWIPKDAIVDPEAIDTIDPSLLFDDRRRRRVHPARGRTNPVTAACRHPVIAGCRHARAVRTGAYLI
ncbi:GntR family transcriptional regulator [Mycolicibacterium sp. CBMA 334]|uniref:GntR family transcriptional regulator n=1 Tax=Mycolicibacterium sp. CBMA 334 TaxID=2606607 RepID=UPI0012DF5726|nr:GntR family transcriptional regulator [Mycolicibacterium sp. CBMA 334]MUM01312.1 GntR family transcriptional regulator [Mycolicibacterium sp. CBMA 334]